MSAMPTGKTCTLVIPGLLAVANREWLSGPDNGRLEHWETFLSRSVCEDFSSPGLSVTLFDLFEIEAAGHHDQPVAAVSYLADAGRPAADWCLRADPVHLIADRDQLVLQGPETLSLSQVEADALAAEFNGFFAQDGWRIEACTPTRWYLHLPDDPQLHSHELTEVRGRAIMPYLPKGPQGKHWQRMLNEIQMLFHASSINAERQAHGQPVVNSLWFWGGGRTPSPGVGRWHQVWSNEPLGLGLAQLNDIPRAALPDTAQHWLDQTPPTGEHLLVLDEFRESGEDPQAWQQAMVQWQSQWLEPLMAALGRGDIRRLTLYPADGRCFSLSRAGLKRWWRRRRPLAGFLSHR